MHLFRQHSPPKPNERLVKILLKQKPEENERSEVGARTFTCLHCTRDLWASLGKMGLAAHSTILWLNRPRPFHRQWFAFLRLSVNLYDSKCLESQNNRICLPASDSLLERCGARRTVDVGICKAKPSGRPQRSPDDDALRWCERRTAGDFHSYRHASNTAIHSRPAECSASWKYRPSALQ
jgi:hypothetical protein